MKREVFERVVVLRDLMADGGRGESAVSAQGVSRSGWRRVDGIECLRDQVEPGQFAVVFLRMPVAVGEAITLECAGRFRLESAAAGGWLLLAESGLASYWIPALPLVRSLDGDGHILTENPAELAGLTATADAVQGTVRAKAAGMLDLAVCEVGAGLAEELRTMCPLETQRYFLYASHGTYRRPADLFGHLVHGHLYNGEFAWPRKWRIPDELDAYALYLILSGLETATGKHLYGLLKRLVVMAVISRQRDDGGWYHGEWTDRMECHIRLHCGGIHLLATAYEEEADPTVGAALARATAFAAATTDETGIGTWFLHDTLETSVEGMKQSPFRWLSSRVLGKSESNMLVLNTHLDTLVAIDRYRRLTGDSSLDGMIESGLRAAGTILDLRPAEGLYSLLYRLIDLVWRPPEAARRLPLPVRALRRLVREHLIPRMNQVRTHFPRLVMPNGYVERAITLAGSSHSYQSVNLWDLIRFRRRFPEPDVGSVIENALAYTQHSHLRSYWASLKAKGHGLGFWADALWHLCMADGNPLYRRWLAEAMLDCHDSGFGLPPALLGANTEGVAPRQRRATPIPRDPDLLVANLGRGDRDEVVVVNPTGQDRAAELIWRDGNGDRIEWQAQDGAVAAKPMVVPARRWRWGQSVPEASSRQGVAQ